MHYTIKEKPPNQLLSDKVANLHNPSNWERIKQSYISMNELSNHTRLFKNVKACKELNWQEKAILSEIISYQLDGKPFKLKDITLAIELGMDK